MAAYSAKKNRQIVVALALLIGLSGAGLSVTLIVALLAPTGPATDLTGLSIAYDSRANMILGTGVPSRAALGQASDETRASLSRSPANATSWLRLAYIDSELNDGLTADGLEALRRSYAVAPYGPDNTQWRLAFALNHWEQITPELRRRAMEEYKVTQSTAHWRLDGLEDRVSDPAGRVAVALMRASKAR